MLLTQTRFRRNLKILFWGLFCILAISTYLIGRIIYDSGLKYYFHYYVRPQDIETNHQPEKIIFLWTPIQGSYKEWSWGIGPDPVISDCDNPEIDGKCLITTHPSLLEKADVVLFSIQDINQRAFKILFSNKTNPNTLEIAQDAFPQVPPSVRMNQLWLLVWYESNEILESDYFITDEYVRSFNGIFNGTLTYRSDSFIPHNFYANNCQYSNTPDFQGNKKDWESYELSAVSKQSVVAWFVSHCDTPSKREDYVKSMNKVIPVDIYGKCGDNTSYVIPRKSKEEKELLSQYKFYLAFENSKCPEYVTEKLYKIINSPISDNPPVPVVMGPKKTWYEENLPKNSFVHVDDFDTPEELGSFLQSLNSQDKQYSKYLNWRRSHKLVCERPVRCKLCNLLLKNKNDFYKLQHNQEDDYPVISDFESFWKRSKCEV